MWARFGLANDTGHKLTAAMEAGQVYEAKSPDPDDWPVVEAFVIRDLLRKADPNIHADAKGLRLYRIRIAGRLDLDHIKTDIALDLHECAIPEGITARYSQLSGFSVRRTKIHCQSADTPIINLSGAILRLLNLEGTTLINCEGPALHADGIKVGSAAFLTGGFTAEGKGLSGAVRLRGARITGQLDMVGAELKNTGGPALSADGIHVGDSMFLSGGFTAEGKGTSGAVRLLGASITGQLDMDGAELTNSSGPALYADGIKIEGTGLLSGNLFAEGVGPEGAVRLRGASITGQFNMNGAELTNTKGSALDADRSQIRGNIFFKDGFTALGAGPDGAVRLRGASVTGQFDLDGAVLSNSTGPALRTIGIEIGQDFLLNLSQPLNSKSCEMDLTDTSVRGRLKVSIESLPTAPDETLRLGAWDVSSLTFRALEGVSYKQWLDFLAHGTKSYSPQPYQQLAAVAQREGHENVARSALIAQHDNQLMRSKSKTEPVLLKRWGRIKKRLLKWTVGYGYRPWLALLWLVGVVAVAVGFMYILWSPGEVLALFDPETQEYTGDCEPVDLWILASKVIPLLDGFDTLCSPENGQEIFFLVMTALKLLAWALLTLFVAGFTQIIRRPVA